MSIKSRVQGLCRDAGISVKDAEIGSGLKVGTMGRWDDSTPSIDKVMKVALFFNVSLDYLAGLTDIKRPAASGDGPVINFLLALPRERLLGILLALEAPEEVLAALDRIEPKE